MKRLDLNALKLVRWTGWALIPLALAFLFTGYVMTGRYGLGTLMKAESALALHRLMHVPLMILLLAHVAPAVYLAWQRWRRK